MEHLVAQNAQVQAHMELLMRMRMTEMQMMPAQQMPVVLGPLSRLISSFPDPRCASTPRTRPGACRSDRRCASRLQGSR